MKFLGWDESLKYKRKISIPSLFFQLTGIGNFHFQNTIKMESKKLHLFYGGSESAAPAENFALVFLFLKKTDLCNN
jgi:hypothetical protein